MNSIKVVPVGSVVVDSLPFSNTGTLDQADKLELAGVKCFAGYLGAMTQKRLLDVLESGMGFMPVTFGGEYEDGSQDELAQLRALGIPPGVTVWLDLEGRKAWDTEASKLLGLIEAWAAPISAAGYVAGLYCGVPQPLTGKQLYKLSGITRYWKGQGRQVDRPTGAIAEPDCGFCMTQMYPSITLAGVLVDANMVGQDYRGRLPTMLAT